MENIWVGSIFLNEGTPFYGMVLGHIMKHPQKWMDFAQKSTIFLETNGMLPSRSTESTPIFPALRGFFFSQRKRPNLRNEGEEMGLWITGPEAKKQPDPTKPANDPTRVSPWGDDVGKCNQENACVYIYYIYYIIH